MQTLLMTSTLDCYYKDENGVRIPKNFGNKNEILDSIKNNLKKQENFVFVASSPEDYEKTDMYSSVIFKSFAMTLPFENYFVLDNRTKSQAKEKLQSADLIFLCGGHVPTQNKFFEDINLKQILNGLDTLIIGASAGSMNMADIVYAEPEEEGESIDPNYKTYLNGLGLTKLSVLPHFLERFGFVLDGKNILNEISIPNSKNRPFIAFSDGDYVMQKDGKLIMFGKSYLFKNNQYNLLTTDGKTDITKVVNSMYNV